MPRPASSSSFCRRQVGNDDWDGADEPTFAEVADSAGSKDGFHISGAIVLAIMFQLSLISNGVTGWMLRMSWVSLCGPTLKLTFFWNGTLMMLPIGFCSFFAISVAL